MGFLDKVLGREQHKCDACGGTFPTREAMAAHAAKDHAKPAASFKCDACGSTFPTREAMAAHGKAAHSM